jgi:hypothetical protein
MLRRCAGNIYSQSRAICRDLRHIVQFARVPKQTLPVCGFFAEFFPQFHGIRQRHEAVACHRAAAQKPDAAARRLGCERRCRHFAPGSSQRCRKALKLANMTCNCLSLKEIRLKNLLCRLGFAVA